jgi:hypothetical protein
VAWVQRFERGRSLECVAFEVEWVAKGGHGAMFRGSGRSGVGPLACGGRTTT